ncbi:hypothetical protein CVT24_008192 [Panaeolus cyanescens]|uniref:Uncharacterized protein n=1 Tax=Panaeolus cyanescens TaxID=181874 RepID=A0A409W0E3_9AGAR|nr:hypothetical protein CVT24_008192 [Panaeolus cyanescens]
MEDASLGRRKRKLPKRYQHSDDDEDFLDAVEPASKHRRSSLSQKSRRQVSDSPPPPDIMEDVEDDAASIEQTVDIEMEDNDFEETQSTVASTSSAGIRGKSTKAKERHAHEGGVSRKRAKVVLSDSEEEYERERQDVSLPHGIDDDDEDDYFSTEEQVSKSSKSKGKASSGGGKATKRKTKASEPDTPHMGGKKGSGLEGSARKKLKYAGKGEESLVDIIGESSSTLDGPTSAPATSTSPATSKQESPAPAPAPKKKLPTIKKNRIPPGTSTGTSTPTSGAKKPGIDLPGSSRPTHEDIRKTIINKTDIDLSDKSIYQAIFSKANDSSIRSGPNREERWKDLNKMREEAKAKREQEALHSFDLQAQYEKISRFEETLRSTRSLALFPNFLGAKWKDVYEKEKMKQKEMAWQGSQDSQMANGKEEGEVG